MARKKGDLGERHHKILEIIEYYQSEIGYPPSIREIGKQADISSTSVVNYYLNQLEEWGYIERDRKISRGVRLAKPIRKAIDDLMAVPMLGMIGASELIPNPSTDFANYDPESSIEVARSLLPERERSSTLFALQVEGDSMIDAMVNDGDIVIMKSVQDASDGDMVAVRLTDTDETTLKFFYRENGSVRLQPANPEYEPIRLKDANSLIIQGKVVLVIRKVGGRPV
jgi:repressor LexA